MVLDARKAFFLGSEGRGETFESTAFIVGRETRVLSSRRQQDVGGAVTRCGHQR